MKTNVKMTKLVRRVMTIAAAMLMVFTVFAAAVPAQAANAAPTEGNTFTFNKYLVMPAEANVPVGTFNFQITPGNPIDATGDSPAIYAGPAGASITNATFTTGDATTTGTPTESDDRTQKYATKEVTVTLTAANFTKPGIYRYTITESGSVSGVTDDVNATRTLDVYVEYKEGSNTDLKFKYYVLHVGTGNPNTAAKLNDYTNTYATNDLTLTKTVTGNQGDRDALFDFTVTLKVASGAAYTVTLPQNGESSNLAKLEDTDKDGTITATYKLKNGQSITINDMAPTDKFAIEESENAAKQGYQISYQLDSNPAVQSRTLGETEMATTAHTVTFTNNRQGSVPTGVLLEIAPYIALAVVVIAGFVVLFATRRRREG